MNGINLSPEAIAKVSARISREVEEWLRDHSVEPHYSVERLAELLEVSERTIENYIELGVSSSGRDGIFPVRRLSFKTMRIPASSVNRFLKACTIAPPAPAAEVPV